MGTDMRMRPISYGASVYSGFAFKSEDFCDTGIPVVKIKNVNNRLVDLVDTEFFPADKVTEKHAKFFLKDGDVLIAMTGQGSVGRVGRVRLNYAERLLLNQRVGKFSTIPGKLDLGYLFYVISTPRYEQILFDAAAGSGQPNLSPQTICSVEIPFPPLPEQKAIAAILGALDDKIALNRRMNATLEAMARALFQSWFVDFGTIPDGWRLGTLGDVATNPRRGVNPDKIAPSTPYIGLEHMPRRCIALGDWGDAEELESNKFEFMRGEILFGKLRPYFHKVGIAPIDGICSTDILVVSPVTPAWFGFVLGHVSSVEFINHTDAASGGTKMPRTSWQDMARYEIALPPESLAAEFSNIIRPAMERITANIHQSRTLAALRDTLLPKLLSGEVRVST